MPIPRKRTFLLLLAVAAAAPVSITVLGERGQPALPTAARQPAAVAFHAMKDPYIAAHLDQIAPIIVEGTVRFRSTGKLSQHPLLLRSLTDEEQSIVDGGIEYVEWTIDVTRWLKGTGPASIIALKGLNGGSLASDTTEGLLSSVMEPGRHVRVYMEPGRAYLNADFFIVMDGKPALLSG